MADLVRLKQWLTDNPDVAALHDGGVAEHLAKTTIDVPRATITAVELFELIDIGEFAAATATQRAHLQVLLALSGDIPVGANSKARTILLAAFGAGSATRAALAAVATVPVTLSAWLGGVSHLDVAEARRGK